ncbi:hypothetical protein LWM68_14310 [Niabella sp. W65]|nr:hypothetical protein [Niabella sp. W65]MCH7363820.1 hypothetical protein [Niabella sp. W65]ULT39727.1 hypothetical protein KRR40_33145 [Niabella sp. I65]
MPYKNIGYVKNASKEAMVNMDISEGYVIIAVYTTSEQTVTIRLYQDGNLMHNATATLSPNHTYHNRIGISAVAPASLKLVVSDQTGKELVTYTPVSKQEHRFPSRPARYPCRKR